MPQLPDVVSRYYASAEQADIDAVVACFAPDATVSDDGRSYRGQAAIRSWRESLASAFTYTTQITEIEQTSPTELVVSTHIEGDFPGGVVDLRQRFTVADGLIADLTT